MRRTAARRRAKARAAMPIKVGAKRPSEPGSRESFCTAAPRAETRWGTCRGLPARGRMIADRGGGGKGERGRSWSGGGGSPARGGGGGLRGGLGPARGGGRAKGGGGAP